MDSNIITSILEIDKKAKEKIAEAEQQKNKIIADAKAEEECIINSKVNAADEKLKELEKEEQRKADERLAEINKEKNEEIKRLDAVYEAKHGEWEDKIYNAIISG